jgi:dihydroorotate dehydrogenase electron transfer subunit
MQIERASVLAHEEVAGGFRTLTLAAPAIASAVAPGQFVHVRVPRMDGATLRRPFSVLSAAGGRLGILYKVVGRGTEALAALKPGDPVDAIGPLGNGFPMDRAGTLPVLVAGGYGVAPLRFFASRSSSRGICFIGAARAAELLCVEDFRGMGWSVEVTTDDGSLGTRGLVTAALDAWLAGRAGGPPPEFYACGPDGMLRAVGARAVRLDANAWLSLDKHMGCGVGACLACVQRVRGADGDVHWLRVCREGPVLEARTIVWDGPAQGG